MRVETLKPTVHRGTALVFRDAPSTPPLAHLYDRGMTVGEWRRLRETIRQVAAHATPPSPADGASPTIPSSRVDLHRHHASDDAYARVTWIVAAAIDQALNGVE